MSSTRNSSSILIAGIFLAAGGFLLFFSFLSEMQIPAFVGLGLTFWGAIFALTRSGNYVDSRLLDSSAQVTYATIDRMVNELKYSGYGYYIPAYPKDVALPDYLKNLREPTVFISDSFDGKPSLDELAQNKFISTQTRGVFVTSPGAGIMAQIEQQLRLDLSKISLDELADIFPKFLAERLNLAKSANLVLTAQGAEFRARGLVYESLYNPQSNPRSRSLLGCPVVSAVASALAKTSGKTVVISEQKSLPGNGVFVVYVFVGRQKNELPPNNPRY
ncbi:hypothetical protein [Candidatus Bathycorpusculum sp.]|uniref:hypothetical protein n=1 Tax=Candidatus Bathycorpusculum sp. TaxID=2994959 RepID=UPI002816CEB9|nr:hypothetical protein [Candidatus Termitimicrobium sp.]MCL2686673.1 hypothetical protein [Candidatus Termitimicrobium sp.]